MKSQHVANEGTALEWAPPKPVNAEKRWGMLIFVITPAIAVLLVAGMMMLKPVLRKMAIESMIKSLSVAVSRYQHAYRALPYTGAAAPLSDTEYQTETPTGAALLEVLVGTSPPNYRGICFWFPTSTGKGAYVAGATLVDGWGKGYRIILDHGNDGRIADPEAAGGTISADVLIYSAGPDGDFTTWGDNLCSWK